MHTTESVAYMVLYFILSILIAWVAFSLILMWLNPAFFNSDGSVNWATTLWVILLSLVFAWVIIIILHLLIRLFMGRRRRHHKVSRCEDSCEEPCEDPCADPCDPCEGKRQNNWGWRWGW